ncbi:DUF3857 domain-containing protein, partial [uncultured Mucilaginibacter sp.]|uniref:DUF3857 domain-containing protein n=1 Tax=uncultured Mucilaginibacter sp. TaxID=797541 RepID=UPI0025D510D2
MTKFFNLLILSLLCVLIKTQAQPAIPGTQPYGTVDKADMELTSCDFERDANAEMLFEKGDLYFTGDLTSITEEIHKRIKIFNDNGKDEANIKIPYYSADRLEFITGIQAETINLVDGKMEITKLDKKLIYTKVLDKETSEISFTMPNVKPGSIIEYKYNWNTTFFVDFPDWYFQGKIPVRYNELSTSIPDVFYFRRIPHLHEPYVKIKSSTDARSLMDDGQSYQYVLNNETKAVANVHSLSDEPFMSSFKDNVESFRYQLVSIRPIGGFQKNFSETWAKVGGHLIDSEDFGGQLNRKLDGEDVIIAKAKTFKTDEEKIAYVFNEVKNTMKWNERDSWGTDDGTSRSWTNKTGNST